MCPNEKEHLVVDKSKEARKPSISKMINEGGLGADNYYDIKKEKRNKKNDTSSTDDNK